MKHYLRTIDQLEKLIEEEKLSVEYRTVIKTRLDKIMKSRFLLIETTVTGTILSVTEVDACQVPLELIPAMEVDSAFYV